MKLQAQEKRSSTKPPPGLKSKDLIGIPWMLAFALRADGRSCNPSWALGNGLRIEPRI